MLTESTNNLSLKEREEIAAIFTKEYYELAFSNGSLYLSHLILRLLQDLGILGLLKNKYASCDEIIAAFNFIPKTRHALEWMLSFLNQEGFLKKRADLEGAQYSYDKAGDIDLNALFEKTVEVDKGIIPSARLMEYVIAEYPAFFKGLKTGFDILFARDKMALWNAYFSNDNSGYGVHNFLGALGVLKWGLKKDNARLLELGGGTGGASVALIDRLKSEALLSRIGEYIFSDVSPIFLRLGNRAIMERTGDDFCYSLKRLDFDKPIAGQGINEDEADVVYAVNALHVAKNLAGSLKNIYRVIKPGGVIILSECCRPKEEYLLLQEVIFNLLDNYVNVDLDRDLRPYPGFLDYEHWERNLEAAGFRNIEAMFNTDGSYPPDLRARIKILAAVIKAEKI